jgi:hypothetical protein
MTDNFYNVVGLAVFAIWHFAKLVDRYSEREKS